MKQRVVFSKSLVSLWALLALAPLLTWAARGSGSRFMVSAALYISGSVLLWTALRLDPRAAQLEAFMRSTLARVTGIGIALTLVMLGVAGMSVDGLLTLLNVLLIGFFALWALGRMATALTRSVQAVLLMGFSIVIALVMGEMIFRLPFVVARTGGNTPGMAIWQSTQYDKVVTTKNPLQLRSLHLEQAKPSGVSRIVALGDSFTWGDKIARTEDTWPYVVERALQQEGNDLEMINMGHTGFTTVNEAELLDRQGWLFDPDLVLLQYNLNDPLPSGPKYFRETESWLFRTQPLSHVFDEVLDVHSYLYSYLNAYSRSVQMSWHYPDGYAPLYADGFAGWHGVRAAMKEMGDATRKRQVPMLVVIFPSFVPGKMDDASYPYMDVHRKVVSSAQAAGLDVLDLRPVFAASGRTGRSWWALPSDGHPSVEADAVAGQAIAKKIEELGLMR